MTALADGFTVWMAGGKNLKAVLANVEQAMNDLSPNAVKHVLGGALTGAQNEGRLAAAEQNPDAVGKVYASEVNDSATCVPCKAIHGKWLANTDNMDKVRTFYPGGGYSGYVKCEGRERCRGTIRIEYEKQKATAVDPDQLAATLEELASIEPDETPIPEPSTIKAPPPPAPPAPPPPAAPAPVVPDPDDEYQAMLDFAKQLAEQDAEFDKQAEEDARKEAEAEAARRAAADADTEDLVVMPRHRYLRGNVESWNRTKRYLTDSAGISPRAGEEMIVHEETEGPLAAWEAALTDRERRAVYIYTTNQYLPMNVALDLADGARDRGDLIAAFSAGPSVIPRMRDTPENMADIVLDLWDALDKHPKREEPVKVYRGVHPDPGRGYNPRAIYEAMNQGDVFEVNGFSSTGLQEAVSEGFTGRDRLSNNGQSVMMEIETRIGANVIGLADLGEDESEIVLPPNTRFEVVEPYDPETMKIKLRVVEDDE